MSAVDKRNMGHSVKQRLLNIARQNGQDFNLLLQRYGMERLLYRLSISGQENQFVLKGASMFLVWKGHSYRVTRDADLLGFGKPDLTTISNLFAGMCSIDREAEDGMVYLSDTLETKSIKENQEYDGIRVKLIGKLQHAHIPLQVDIGFGDAITPHPDSIIYPTLLDAPAPRLRGYPTYTMLSEKFEAMVRLGLANSRMKDFYDIWMMSRLFEFQGNVLCEAITRTFARRQTALPADIPFAFTESFSAEHQKQIQWRAFLKNSKPNEMPGELQTVMEQIASFLLPPLVSLQENTPFAMYWKPVFGWEE